MTLLGDVAIGTIAGTDAPGSLDASPSRLLDLPGRLWHHALALGVVLVVMVVWLDNGSMVSGDEGAVLTQVKILEQTGSWTTPNRSPDLDPTGELFPIDLSDRVGDRFMPYGKHPAYPLLSLGLYRLGGLRMILMGSAAGTLSAAVLAALIGRRLSRRLAIPTLWTVGLASPLIFDASWVIAHSIGAALATGALLSALRVVVDGRRVWVISLAACCASIVMFRSEALVFAAALALVGAMAAVTAHTREQRISSVLLTAAVTVSTIVGVVIDKAWYRAVSGGTVTPSLAVTRPGSFVSGRLDGIWNSLLRPQMIGTTLAGNLAAIMAIAGLVGAVYVRRRPERSSVIRGVAGVAFGCSAFVLVLPTYPIPGLFVAFPLLGVGLVLLRREVLDLPTVRLILGVGGAYALGVVATQYGIGGSTDWGGRYFHLILPALVPVVLAGVVTSRPYLDARTRRVALAGVVVGSLSMGWFAVSSSRSIRNDSASVVSAVVRLSETTSSATAPKGPVVVCNSLALGRRSWEHVFEARYLKVTDRKDLRALNERLVSSDVREFVFVDGNPERNDRPLLADYRAVADRTVTVAGWKLYVMRRSER